MATQARTRVQTVRSSKPQAKPTREQALRKIAEILEGQMTDMGLSEQEKNAKTAELAAFVSDAVTSKLAPDAKQPKQLHSAALQA